MKTTPAQRVEAIERLRELLSPGREVYVVSRGVAKSGMSRRITLHIVDDAGPNRETAHPTDLSAGDFDIRDITILAGHACGFTIIDSGPRFELRIHGGGMDMHFHTVYVLGRTLWPEGTRIPGHTDHRDGGYALTHRTL